MCKSLMKLPSASSSQSESTNILLCLHSVQIGPDLIAQPLLQLKIKASPVWGYKPWIEVTCVVWSSHKAAECNCNV